MDVGTRFKIAGYAVVAREIRAFVDEREKVSGPWGSKRIASLMLDVPRWPATNAGAKEAAEWTRIKNKREAERLGLS